MAWRSCSRGFIRCGRFVLSAVSFRVLVEVDVDGEVIDVLGRLRVVAGGDKERHLVDRQIVNLKAWIVDELVDLGAQILIANPKIRGILALGLEL